MMRSLSVRTLANDGNPVYISWVVGGNTVSYDQMNDDFFGGGDVGIGFDHNRSLRYNTIDKY